MTTFGAVFIGLAAGVGIFVLGISVGYGISVSILTRQAKGWKGF